MQRFRYIDNTATLLLDEERCVGCGNCLIVCPHRVFAVAGRKVRISDLDGCIECGACATNCPQSAISVTPGVGCAAAYIQSFLRKITGGKVEGGCC